MTLKSCDASKPIDNATTGDCSLNLASGSTCTPKCDDGYKLSGKTSCESGVLTPAKCWKPEVLTYPQ